MHQELDEIVDRLSTIFQDSIIVERRKVSRGDLQAYDIVSIRPRGLDCAASLELGHGDDGWDVCIDWFQARADDKWKQSKQENHQRAIAMIFGTVYGGCGIYRIGRRHFIVFGDHDRIASTLPRAGEVRPKLQRSWCRWRDLGGLPDIHPSSPDEYYWRPLSATDLLSLKQVDARR